MDQEFRVLVDNNNGTTFGMRDLTSLNPAYIIVDAGKSVILSDYILYNGGDTPVYPGRRWRNWVVYGSNSSTANGSWTTIDTRYNQEMPISSFGPTRYYFPNTKSFRYYKFEISDAYSGNEIQMSDLILVTGNHHKSKSNSNASSSGGSIQQQSSQKQWRLCPSCAGSGRCPHCNGTGYKISSSGNYYPCGGCNPGQNGLCAVCLGARGFWE